MTQTTDRPDAVPPTGPAPDAAADLEALAAVESAGPPPEPITADTATTAAEVPVDAAAALAGEAADPVIDGIDALVGDGAEGARDAAGADAPLLDGDLEQGIATIFAALHSATSTDGPSWPDAGAAADQRPADAFAWLRDEDDDDDGVDVEAVDLSTFRLLGELDRLWQRAA